MTFHEQVKASRATVDKELVELLECLWAAGFQTQFSCQGGGLPEHAPEPASITFSTLDEAIRFALHTMERSHWSNRITIKLGEPIYDPLTEGYGPVRGHVTWPAIDRYSGRSVTAELTDVWARRQRPDDLYTRRIASNSNGAAGQEPASKRALDESDHDLNPSAEQIARAIALLTATGRYRIKDDHSNDWIA